MKRLVTNIVQHPLIAERPSIRQFLKFGIVGAGNTLVDFGLYVFLTRVAHAYFLLAHVGSFLCAVVVSYILNKRWTFRDTSRPLLSRQLGQFLVVSAVGAVLSSLLLFGLVEYAGLPDLVGKVLAIGIVLFWNFFANKHWTFQSRI